jgi:hypothetical protein
LTSLIMSSCCTLRLKRRSAFSRDSPSCNLTSANELHPQTRPSGLHSYCKLLPISQGHIERVGRTLLSAAVEVGVRLQLPALTITTWGQRPWLSSEQSFAIPRPALRIMYVALDYLILPMFSRPRGRSGLQIQTSQGRLNITAKKNQRSGTSIKDAATWFPPR